MDKKKRAFSFNKFDKESSSIVDNSLAFADLSGSSASKKIIEISIDELRPNPDQPRKVFKDEDIIEMAESIKTFGILEPILVRPDGEFHMIIAGERRYRAARQLGLETIPCLVKDVSDEDAYLISLIENLQRKDIDPFEEAAGYQRLIDQYSITQENIARTVGKSRTTITESLSINRLPETIRMICRETDISKTNIIEIAKASSEKEMLALIESINSGQLQSKQIRKTVRKLKEKNTGRPRSTDTYVTVFKHAKTYGKYLSKLAEVNIQEMPDSERKKIKERILENRKLEDGLLEIL
jgi:ParB family transcriptional regulator, chromosome partitioning protein